ncbi:MAG: hypothetical protein JWO04_1133 [Gammaproteobacteria bacterium]|nr:hypothetical protein [Gammaproteobacteria bacterium]
MRYRLAGAFAFCSLATLTLLANHPMPGAHTFADLIKAEARNQFVDGLVHGGFMATLSVLIVCFVFLSRALGMARVAVVAAFVAFCIGCGALMGSMILDGFVVPAIAVRFSGMGSADALTRAETEWLAGITCRIACRERRERRERAPYPGGDRSSLSNVYTPEVSAAHTPE